MRVRLHPYLPRLGYVLQRLTIFDAAGNGYRFHADRGWYELPDDFPEDVLARMKSFPQNDRRPGGPKAFLFAKNALEARQIDEEVESRFRRAEGEDDSVGTAETPVKPAQTRPRPGQRGGEPKSRRRRA